jgi:hypothetical protein
MTEQTIGTPAQLPQERNPVELEWHPTPRLWVAYRGCGCEECPKGYGKTKEEAIADLGRCHRVAAAKEIFWMAPSPTATPSE